MKKKVKPKKENSERWLLTYSDMITLLLALFILLYGMSTVDQAKYEQFAESMHETFGQGKGQSIFDGKNGVLPNNGNKIMPNSNGKDGNSDNAASLSVTPKPTLTPNPTQAANPNDNSLTTKEEMNALEQGIDQIINDLGVKGTVGTVLGESGLTILLTDKAFFDSGKAELKPSMIKSLSEIARLLKNISNQIIVAGYTDNVPVSASSEYTSNWDLSGARAASVTNYLTDKEGLDNKRIADCGGRADNNPIASNKTEEGRMKNRRVEITILYN